MKKTLTINLSGTVLHIDEDAYEALSQYLDQLRNLLSQEQGADEILNDIEDRLRDLFDERLRYGLNVIRIIDVEEIIQVMGRPEEIAQDFDTLVEDHQGASQASDTGEAEEPKDNRFSIFGNTGKKKLMRDPDQTIFLGVCGGLSHYLGIDTWIIRLIFLILFFVGSLSILILYLALGFILPKGCTIANKLEMRGIEPTVENIRQAKQEGILTPCTDSQGSNSGLNKGCLIALLIPLVLIFVPLILGIIFMWLNMASNLPFNSSSFEFHITRTPFGGFFDGMNAIVSGIATILVFVLPVGAMAYAYFQRKGKLQPLKQVWIKTSVLLWIIAAVIFSSHFWQMI